jgi:hypothetical protein
LGGLTSRGKVVVREAAIGLEETYGRKNLTFWTLTLPGLPPDDWRNVCENWSAIVKNLKTKLLYWLEKKGCPLHIVAVTELQEKRWEREKVPAWHLHLVFVGKTSTGGWVLTPKKADKLWKDAVESYISSPVSFHSASQLQQVRKSVGGYLSKYLSKGSAVISAVESAYPGCVPSTWYICTGCLRKWVDVNTRQSMDIARYLHQLILDSPSEIRGLWAFCLESRPGCKIAVCWLGRMPDPPAPRVPLS